MTEQKNAPGAGGNQPEGEFPATPSHGESKNMDIISETATGREYRINDPGWKYHGWTVRLLEDTGKVHYTENVTETELLRVHYRIARVPALRQFSLRHLRGATDEDRAEALEKFERLPWMFADFESRGCARRVKNREHGYWVYSIHMGTPVEDPLIQLELEMMIDLSSGVSL